MVDSVVRRDAGLHGPALFAERIGAMRLTYQELLSLWPVLLAAVVLSGILSVADAGLTQPVVLPTDCNVGAVFACGSPRHISPDAADLR